MDMIIPNWPAPKNIKAFASTRLGGQSCGVYQGLNLGTHVGDDAITVQHNRQWLAEQAEMPSAPVWLNQTHSTRVFEAVAPSDVALDCDGVFTRAKGVVCSAMTADCLPVLLTNLDGSQVAAVHAGWRGLADGIIENAISQFDSPVMAWIGPAIGTQAFEVGQEVVDIFCAADPKAVSAFKAKAQPTKYLADMNLLVTQRLNSVGVEQIYYSGLCTYQNPQQFYSYRRDGTTGRQASFIWIES